MIMSRHKIILLVTTATVFVGGLLWNGSGNLDSGFISKAEARVGRPLTPMSYAGVARRTTRRAVVVGGAVAAGAVAAGAYAAPACAQVVDAYGQVYTRC